MRKSRFTDSQILDAVKRVEAGIGVPDLCTQWDGCSRPNGIVMFQSGGEVG